jgi:hypothetical protein
VTIGSRKASKVWDRFNIPHDDVRGHFRYSKPPNALTLCIDCIS